MSLAEDAKAAKKAGLTYGKYMTTKSTQSFFAPVKRFCKSCGVQLAKNKERFCCSVCRQDYISKFGSDDPDD